jgi:glycosyltransferase involved in cell wall biosynthesis
VPAVAGALERLLFDEGTRRRLLEAAPATLARYDWGRAARETLAVIEGAL